MILTRILRPFKREGRFFSTNSEGKPGYSQGEKIKFNLYFTTYKKLIQNRSNI